MNRIDKLFKEKKENILSIYFTAGYPGLNSTEDIILELEKNGVDMIEIGIPFSDPMADGAVIQNSSHVALQNGMTLEILFDQLQSIRKKTNIPLLLMGYLNPVYKYGISNFTSKANEVGIDGLIIPDLPLDIYQREYRDCFENHQLKNIFLVSPLTHESRIQEIDKEKSGFIYFVSSASTTGVQKEATQQKLDYFQRIKQLNLQNGKMIGFGIGDSTNFDLACNYANGAIIGSAFVNAISEGVPNISKFISSINSKTPSLA